MTCTNHSDLSHIFFERQLAYSFHQFGIVMIISVCLESLHGIYPEDKVLLWCWDPGMSTIKRLHLDHFIREENNNFLVFLLGSSNEIPHCDNVAQPATLLCFWKYISHSDWHLAHDVGSTQNTKTQSECGGHLRRWRYLDS